MSHWTDELFLERPAVFGETLAGRYEAAAGEVTDLLSLLAADGHDPDRVLDVACGIGRHVVAFAEAGLDADGIDYAPAYVERARENAAAAGVADRATVEVADMRDLEAYADPGTYDLVTVFYNSLGYYGRDTDVAVLSAARELLAEGGRLVVEATNKDLAIREFEESSVRELDGDLLVQRVEYDPATGRQRTTVDRFRPVDGDDGDTVGSDAGDDAGDGDAVGSDAGDGSDAADRVSTGGDYEHISSMEFAPRLYAPVEFRELCSDAGFESVQLYGGFDGGPVTFDSPRVLVVAE